MSPRTFGRGLQTYTDVCKVSPIGDFDILFDYVV